MNPDLRARLLRAAAALALAGVPATVVVLGQRQTVSAAVELARVIGAHYESSNRHIGRPYIDGNGRGRPWTVCAGITGPAVDPDRYYTPDDCRQIELPMYLAAERRARAALAHWDAYNVWVQASFIDLAFNVPAALDARQSSAVRLANAGQLDQACAAMERWVYGRDASGAPLRLAGLVDRRQSTRELCAQWGRSGHFSVPSVQANSPEHLE